MEYVKKFKKEGFCMLLEAIWSKRGRWGNPLEDIFLLEGKKLPTRSKEEMLSRVTFLSDCLCDDLTLQPPKLSLLP